MNSYKHVENDNAVEDDPNNGDVINEYHTLIQKGRYHHWLMESEEHDLAR